MKKKFICLASFLLVFSFMLFGCGSISLQGGPEANATVYGNGGSIVSKGEYLYFANAFIDHASIGINDNTYDKKSPQTIYGIYRTKLTNGKVKVGEHGIPQGAEILTYNVGGHAYAGLYIFGDYLYYTTPFSQKTSGNVENHGLMRFERVRLNGTGHEILYSENNYSSDCSYDMVYVDNNVYILFTNKDKDLKVIKCTATSKSPEPYVISSKITSYAVFEQEDLKANDTVEDVNKFIYYTTQDEETKISYLNRVDFSKKNNAEVLLSSKDELLIEDVKNNQIYYRKANILYSTVDGNTEKYYTNIPLKAIAKEENGQSQQTESVSLVDYFILDSSIDGLDRGIMGILFDGTNYSCAIYNNSGKVIIPFDTKATDKTKAITILGSHNNEFYYQVAEDKSVYFCELAISFGNSGEELDKENMQQIKVASNFDTSETGGKVFDCDSNGMYVFKKITDTSLSYLKMYEIEKNPATDNEGNILGQYIGLLRKEDIPKSK